MHCAPMRISSAMTKGPSLASQVAARPAREPRLDALIDDVSLTGRAVGQSVAWRTVLKMAIQVAATGTTTCLQGESGVGKEVVARVIHRCDPQKLHPEGVPANLCAWRRSSSRSRSRVRRS
jgi:transcriptional regulator with GAF, ATPase, and Fis domain